MTIQEKLQLANGIETSGRFLEDAVGAGFLSRPEATGIFKDILKETGFKKAEDVKVAPKEEAK